jgi:hypothetical protein
MNPIIRRTIVIYPKDKAKADTHRKVGEILDNLVTEYREEAKRFGGKMWWMRGGNAKSNLHVEMYFEGVPTALEYRVISEAETRLPGRPSF